MDISVRVRFHSEISSRIKKEKLDREKTLLRLSTDS